MVNFRQSLLVGSLLVAGTSHEALALDAAPMPDGIETSPEAGYVVGIYVRAHARDENAPGVRVLADASRRCQMEHRELHVVGDSQLLGTSNYWVYRTDSHATLFSRSYDVRFGAGPCEAEIYETRSVSHSLVADGFVYDLFPDSRRGRWSASQSAVQNVGEWPGPFNSDVDCGTGCKAKRIAGVSARCLIQESSFVGRTDCVSGERGITRGMTVYRNFWTDDGQGNSFELEEMRRSARISRSIFDLSVEYSVRQ